MGEEFISRLIKPLAGTFDTAAMTRGEPGLPKGFIWKDKECVVAEVVEVWKETGPCKTGANEMYLRKHWFRFKTLDGLEMTVYFERQARSKSQSKSRWWLYTINT